MPKHKQKSSFVLHHDSLEILDELDLKQRGELFTAIYNYQIGEDVGTLSQVVKIVFMPFKNQFDRDNIKYIQACETNKKNALSRYGKDDDRESEPLAANGSDPQPIAPSGSQSQPFGENGKKNLPNSSDKESDNDTIVPKTGENESDFEMQSQFPIIKNSAIEQKFLDLFNKLKKQSQPESNGHTTMSDTAKRNLKRLLDKGRTFKDFEKAIKAMLQNDWAINTDNDIPEHLVREESFTRYLNQAEKSAKSVKPSDEQQLIEE